MRSETSHRPSRLLSVDSGSHDSSPSQNSIRNDGIFRLAPAPLSPATPATPRSPASFKEVELDYEKGNDSQLSSPTSSSAASTTKRVVSFEKDDPDNPVNWTTKKKLLPLTTAIVAVLNSTISSSLSSGASSELSAYFDVTNQSLLVLPTSIFIVGYVVGPLIFGPLSEFYGRKWVMTGAFAMFTAFTLGCALAQSFAQLVVFRLLVGVPGSCAISVVGGICADVYNDPLWRGRAMAVYMAATTFGPLIGPIISGFISVVDWRWTFWVGLIIAGITWVPLVLMPETYAPIILKQRAARLRKETGDPSIVAPIEVENKGWKYVVVVVLTRPIRMMLFEWLVLFCCVYLSFVYAVFYLLFQAFPIIYKDGYGFNAGEEGLAFLPIGVGVVFASIMYLAWDAYLGKAAAQGKSWTHTEEARRLPLACMAGPFLVGSLFWIGWSARPGEVHWIVPVLGGIPYGIGYLLIFMSILNYLVDAYETFSASAMAASGTARSIFGAALPFAAKPMYGNLGVGWACSVLGFIMLALCGIPFVFIKYGDKIRANSAFCRELKEKKEKERDEVAIVVTDESDVEKNAERLQ
ncbi:membrane transporter [Phyllosticta citribraziliensis]|uniref:Membrane transporter n=1 Tax=Phyllosticta citribraziliensis TaxID=989973 RepID=A0ABR1LIC9_9PEZI